MPRDFASERYVRTYVQDTKGWLLLGWRGQTVWSLLYRKVDPLGFIALEGVQAWELGVLKCGLPEEVAKPGMERCLETQWIVLVEQAIQFPRFDEANSAAMSGATRTRLYRDLEQAKRAQLQRNVTELCNDSSQTTVTDRYGLKRNVTAGNETLQLVAEPEIGQIRLQEHQDAVAGAAWLAAATSCEPYPLTKRWKPSLMQLGQKPEAQKLAAHGVLQREASRGFDVRALLTPDHVLNYWHYYSVGKVPGKQAPLAAAAPTELDVLQQQWATLDKRERECLYDEDVKRTRIQQRKAEVSAKIKAIEGGSNGRG